MESPVRIRRADIEAALKVDGFEDWVSTLDSPLIDRPETRPSNLPGSGRHAAVMLLLFEPTQSADAQHVSQISGPQLVLIRRSHQLRYHAGQMAFPGGRQDPGETLQATAVRETHEEIGVALHQNDILGSLRSIYIPPSDYTLAPYVSWLSQPPSFVIAPEEVDQVVSFPLARFLDSNAQRRRQVTRDNGETIWTPCYVYQDYVIWGATALVLSELLARLMVVVRD